MNIADSFAENARKRPGHPAVEDGKRIVTYAELKALANTDAVRPAGKFCVWSRAVVEDATRGRRKAGASPKAPRSVR